KHDWLHTERHLASTSRGCNSSHSRILALVCVAMHGIGTWVVPSCRRGTPDSTDFRRRALRVPARPLRALTSRPPQRVRAATPAVVETTRTLAHAREVARSDRRSGSRLMPTVRTT